MKYSRALLAIVLCVSTFAPSIANAATCYAPPVVEPTGPDPNALVAGDITGDGNDDFIVAYRDLSQSCGGGANVFVGNGDGTFQEKDLTTRANPSLLAVGDFNRDGKQDLAIWNAGCATGDRPAIEIKVGNADGTFTSKAVYLTPPTISAITAADFNGDFITDLFLANGADSASHKLLLGAGNGTFPRSNNIPPFTGFNFVAGAAAADFNADGKPDLAMFSADFNSAIALSNGDGTFQPVPFIFPGFMQALGDINGDSKLDIANFVPNQSHYQLSVNTGNGDGTLTQKDSYLSPSAGPIVVANVGLDGITDLVAAVGQIRILKGNGDGTFRVSQTFDPGAEVGQMMGADFNRDGLTDLVFTHAGAAGTSGATVLLDTRKCR